MSDRSGRITIEAISSIRPDAATDVAHIDCATQGEDAHLELQAGALSALMLGLRQAAEALDPDSNEFAGQPLEITGVGLISSPTSGKRALQVILDGTLRLILIVPEAAISPLHECLSALGEHPDG